MGTESVTTENLISKGGWLQINISLTKESALELSISEGPLPCLSI